jgi:hypothetical protein
MEQTNRQIGGTMSQGIWGGSVGVVTFLLTDIEGRWQFAPTVVGRAEPPAILDASAGDLAGVASRTTALGVCSASFG